MTAAPAGHHFTIKLEQTTNHNHNRMSKKDRGSKTRTERTSQTIMMTRLDTTAATVLLLRYATATHKIVALRAHEKQNLAAPSDVVAGDASINEFPSNRFLRYSAAMECSQPAPQKSKRLNYAVVSNTNIHYSHNL